MSERLSRELQGVDPSQLELQQNMSAMRATVVLQLTRSRPPPLSRITDGSGNVGSTFGRAACQYVSGIGRLIELERL
jgi:hypothetical protein